jgi:hypothetical protein
MYTLADIVATRVERAQGSMIRRLSKRPGVAQPSA